MMWSVANICTYEGGIYTTDSRPPFPANVIYIGRGGRGVTGSPLANPFVPMDSQSKILGVSRVADPILSFRRWLFVQLTHYPASLATQEIDRIARLEPGVLLCFCHPKPCHGDVLVKAIHWYQQKEGIV